MNLQMPDPIPPASPVPIQDPMPGDVPPAEMPPGEEPSSPPAPLRMQTRAA